MSSKISHETSNQKNMIIRAIEFLKTTLQDDYDQDDLMAFYDYVHKEYSLGLKCTRTQNKTNMTKTSDSSISTIDTTNSSRLVTLSAPPRKRLTHLLRFIIDNSHVCSDESIDLVIVIISKSDNYETRDAIRRTWASGKDLGIYSLINVKYLFLIDFNEQFAQQIQLENKIFQDIIQVELPQHYTLVTFRVLSVFEWSFRYCRRAKFLFKTDDDVFVNMLLLLKFISPLIKHPVTNSFSINDMNIYGYKHNDAQVVRDATDHVGMRYVVTLDEYPCERYPTFLSGFGYLISRKARDAILYAVYQDPEPFRISDVYFTGIIPDYLSITRQSLSNYEVRYENGCEDFFHRPTAFACASDVHHGSASNIFPKFYFYWQLIKKTHKFID